MEFRSQRIETFLFLITNMAAMTSFFTREVNTVQLIKLLTFHDLCFRHYDILAETRSRNMTANTFSRQNDADSRVSTT